MEKNGKTLKPSAKPEKDFSGDSSSESSVETPEKTYSGLVSGVLKRGKKLSKWWRKTDKKEEEASKEPVVSQKTEVEEKASKKSAPSTKIEVKKKATPAKTVVSQKTAEKKEISLEPEAKQKASEESTVSPKAVEKASLESESSEAVEANKEAVEANKETSEEPVSSQKSTEEEEASLKPEVKTTKPQDPTASLRPEKKEEASQELEAKEEKSQVSPQEEAKEEKPEKPAASQEAKLKKEPSRPQIKLNGLFAFKLEMTSFYNEEGKAIPVTALHYEPWRVSQIKNKEKEGYSSIQLACYPQKNKRCSKPLVGHLAPADFKEGARYIKELRQEPPEDIQVGHELSIESLKIGDFVRLSSRSKGRGFAGVMKRWGFRGGKASHGSKSHRRPGSIGQHTEPSRVFAGRKMPGHYGFQKVSLKKVEIVDVLPEENLIFVKGPVPGSRHTLVTLKKEESLNA